MVNVAGNPGLDPAHLNRVSTGGWRLLTSCQGQLVAVESAKDLILTLSKVNVVKDVSGAGW